MKSYTDLEQSKKLAEILPNETADMEYILERLYDEKTRRYKEGYCEIPVVKVDDDCPLQPITIPCWSLAALMNLLPKGFVLVKDSVNEKYHLFSKGCMGKSTSAESPIDAVFEMIVYLKENKLI